MEKDKDTFSVFDDDVESAVAVAAADKKSKVYKHSQICLRLNEIYQKKNHDYGDSFGKSYKEYGMTMACIRLEDKLNRIKALSRSDNPVMVVDETIEDTLLDLANYAIMTLVERWGE